MVLLSEHGLEVAQAPAGLFRPWLEPHVDHDSMKFRYESRQGCDLAASVTEGEDVHPTRPHRTTVSPTVSSTWSSDRGSQRASDWRISIREYFGRLLWPTTELRFDSPRRERRVTTASLPSASWPSSAVSFPSLVRVSCLLLSRQNRPITESIARIIASVSVVWLDVNPSHQSQHPPMNAPLPTRPPTKPVLPFAHAFPLSSCWMAVSCETRSTALPNRSVEKHSLDGVTTSCRNPSNSDRSGVLGAVRFTITSRAIARETLTILKPSFG